MKVALVHDFLFKLGGAERVLKELANLYPQAPIYTLIYDEEKCGQMFPRKRVVESKLKKYPRFLQKRPQLLLGKMPEAIEDFDFSEFDLVISSSGAFSHGIITPPRTKHLCYCHSPMRYAWDYTHEYLAEKKLSWWKELLARLTLHQVRQWDRVAADRPDAYLANSKHVAKRLRKYFQTEAEVLYPPVDIDRFYPHGESGEYFLMISALSPFKKVDLAVSAFNKMGKPLLVIGDGEQRQALEALVGPTVEILGRKTDEEVRRYLQNCRALVFPGEEDFGIAPVEAMACGKPVIAYGKGGVLESVVDGITGVFFEELTVAALEDAVARFYQIERSLDRDIIRKRAEEFGREQFVEGVKQAVKKLYKQKS
ncbi:MAG: glycosyltransferase [bacterium]|nr:glycosyltransferase [bacterium]